MGMKKFVVIAGVFVGFMCQTVFGGESSCPPKVYEEKEVCDYDGVRAVGEVLSVFAETIIPIVGAFAEDRYGCDSGYGYSRHHYRDNGGYYRGYHRGGYNHYAPSRVGERRMYHGDYRRICPRPVGSHERSSSHFHGGSRGRRCR